MMVAISADAYAATRLNVFFPANNQTSVDGNLTGQCVTLVKWFMAEMTEVPYPFSARGHARYAGDTLVAQGHAIVVSAKDRKPGDIVTWKYGKYGHTGILLSGDRVFESNVNAGNVQRRVVDGSYVYSSRIGKLDEAWRNANLVVYRIKTYKGDNMPTLVTKEFARMLHSEMEGWDLGKTHTGVYDKVFMDAWGGKPIEDLLWQKWKTNEAFRGQRERNRKFYDMYSSVISGLSDRPTVAEYEKALAQINVEAKKAQEAEQRAQKSYDEAKAATIKAGELQDEKETAEKTGNAFMRWLGDQLNKLIGKGN